MKKKFTKLTAALALLALFILPLTGWGQADTYTFSEIYSNITGSSSCDISSDAGTYSGLTYTKGTGNQPKYYANGSAIRLYNGNTLTVAANTDYLITAVTIHHNSSQGGAGNVTITDGSLSGNDYSWSKADGVTSLDFAVSGTCRIGSIEVTVKSSGSVGSNYIFTYKANKGDATPDITDETSNGSITLKPSNTFEFAGHEFYRWNTEANGTGTNYEAGTILNNVTSGLTLYARWNYNVAVSTLQGVTINAAYNSNYLTGNTNAVPRGAQIGLSVTGLGANQVFNWSILKSSDSSDVTSQVLSGTTLTVPDYDIIIGGSVVQEDPSFEIVFAETDNGGNCQNNNGSWNVTGGSLALSCAANSSSGVPVYNSNSEELRIYGKNNNGGSITLTPTTVTITKVVLTASTGYANAVKYFINGASTGTDLTWNGVTGTVDNINGNITFQNAADGTTQVRIKKIKIYYSVPETFTPTVALNYNSYGTLAGPTENVYTVTPNEGYKIVDFTKTNNVTVEQLTGDAFSASSYRIIATAANQTVTFNLAQRTGASVTLHDGLNGATTTAVNTYTDATLADVIEGHTIASVNGWTALGWVKSYTSGTPTLITTTETVGSTTDLYAVYKKGSNTFSRITSTDDLAVDGIYMICYNSNTTYNFMNDVSSDYMGYTDANSVSENSFEYVAGKKFTLGGSSSDGYTFADGDNYLVATQGNQYLGLSSSTLTDYGKWTIEFESSKAKITNKGHAANNYANLYMSYHTNNNYFNCYKYYSGNNYGLYLYKQISNDLQYSIAPTAELCHVYYNANGATTGNVPEDNTGYNPNTNVTILGNTGTLAKTGYTWSGWCLNAEGTGTVYGPTPYTTTYTLQENTTFYAKWVVNSHDWSTDLTNAVSGTTVQLKVNNAVVAANTQINYGTEVTIEVTIPNNYIYSISVNNGAVSVTNNKFTMPDEDVTVAVTTQVDPYSYAILSSSDMAGMTTEGNEYDKLKYTTIDGYYWESNGQQANATGTTNRLGMLQLRDRTKTENSYIKLPVFNGKIESIVLTVTNGSATESTGAVCKATFNFQTSNASDGAIIIQGGNSTDGTREVTLDLSEKFCNTGYIKIHDNSNAARIWNIAVTYLPYNNFTDLDPTAPMPTLEAGDNYAVPSNMSTTDLTIPATAGIVIKSGATLTVSGTLTNNGTAANLIILDGAQLFHTNTVAATVQKSIEAYTISGSATETADGWYFIASPLTTDYTPAGTMIANDYDLYRLNGTQWENAENSAHSADFKLVNGHGYLYANNTATTLSFAGNTKGYSATDNKVDVSAGFNLIGNPYTFNTYINDDFYVLNADRNGVDAVAKGGTYPIKPCTGVIYEAASNGQVAFSNEAASGNASKGNVNMTLSQEVATRGDASSVTIDNAIVSFNEGSQLSKFYFGQSNANIFIPQNGKDYAIVSAEAQGEMPVNFKAAQNGTYTISVETENVEMNYLHLIDNRTGMDVDLLATPSYSFEAKTSDYAYRFRLVFSANSGSDDSNDNFAFISNGKIIITGLTGNETLQMIDALGRLIVSTNATERVATDNMAPGVYVIRLVNGSNVKTQKIVVK